MSVTPYSVPPGFRWQFGPKLCRKREVTGVAFWLAFLAAVCFLAANVCGPTARLGLTATGSLFSIGGIYLLCRRLIPTAIGPIVLLGASALQCVAILLIAVTSTESQVPLQSGLSADLKDYPYLICGSRMVLPVVIALFAVIPPLRRLAPVGIHSALSTRYEGTISLYYALPFFLFHLARYFSEAIPSRAIVYGVTIMAVP